MDKSDTRIMVPVVTIEEEFDDYGGKLRGKKGFQALWVLEGECDKPSVHYGTEMIEVTTRKQWEEEDGTREDPKKHRMSFKLNDPRINIRWKEKEIT